jgi:DNA repair protein SbcC/Rad50
MIPIKLTLKGIHSYREMQIIEFDKLTEAGLFGIFGKVGSGKSTILEAISFVLFGKRERASNYDLFNLRSDKLLIDFECRAGRDNHLYRFVVDGRRNGKQFDKVSVDRKAYQWLDELKDWSPIGYEDPAEKIIGLSYDNFKRTIIIPQGRFQDFIDLGDTERTKMLKELFRLERFDLSKQVSTIKAQNKDKLTENQAKIDAIGDVSEEVIAAKEHELKMTKELFLIENTALVQLQKEANEIEQLRINVEKLNKEQAKIAELSKQSPIFNERKQVLKNYEYCFLNFKSLFDRRADYTQKSNRDQSELQSKESSFKAIQEQLNTQIKTLDLLRPQYNTRQALKDQATELNKVVEIKENTLKKQKIEDRVLKGEVLLKTQNDAISKRQESNEILKTKYQTAKQSLPDVLQLSEINTWFGQNKYLLEARKKLKEEADGLVEKEKSEQLSIPKLIIYEDIALVPDLPQDATILVIIEKLKTIQQQKKQENTALDLTLNQLNIQKALQQYADGLIDGKPCPLCGSVHHPEALSSSDDMNTHIKTIKKQQIALSDLSDFILKAISKLENIQSNLDSLTKRKAEIKTDWSAKTDEIERHKQVFVWQPKFSPDQPEAIEAAFVEAKIKKTEIEALEKKIETETKAIEIDKQTVVTKYEKPIGDLRTESAALQSVIESLQNQLQKLNFQDFVQESVEIANKKVADLELQYKKITIDFEIVDKIVKIQTNEKSGLEGVIKTLNDAIGRNREDLVKVEKELLTEIEKSEFESEFEIADVLKNALNIDKERTEIQTFEHNIALAEAAVMALLKTVGSQVYEAEKEQELKNRITDLLKITTDLQKIEGGLNTELVSLQTRFGQQKELQTARKKMEARQADINLIDGLFRSNGFVNYVSSVYLQNLCNHANERFYRMTRQQLQLEIYQKEGKYDFQVRDLLNDGRTRALSSLSGGQKFQASLSLALALADSIHTQNEMKENFFFLDEGFGSLDRESLQIVFETLKSLRRENRIVGIISHVEDLQQEIDRYLIVTNDEELGSLVAIQ